MQSTADAGHSPDGCGIRVACCRLETVRPETRGNPSNSREFTVLRLILFCETIIVSVGHVARRHLEGQTTMTTNEIKAANQVQNEVRAWLVSRPADWLQAAAEGESGRAKHAMTDGSNLHTVYYFARESARYASALLTKQEL